MIGKQKSEILHDLILTVMNCAHPSANWWKEITEGIENADSFVFVVTPDSVASPICNFEIAHAIQHNKRIVPIVYREVNETESFASLASVKLNDSTQEILGNRELMAVARQSWSALARHNWVMFVDDNNFDETFDQFLKIINTDLAHTKVHTRLLIRALEWDGFDRNLSFLLLGDEITSAEEWLSTAGVEGLTPVPTNLHREYILLSREAEETRQRRIRNLRLTSIVAGVIGVVAVIMTIVSITALSESAVEAELANNIIGTSTAVLGTQASDSEFAQQAVLNANATLTNIPPTLNAVNTQVANQIAVAESLRIAAEAQEASNSNNDELAISLAIEANQIALIPPAFSQRILSNIVYGIELPQISGGTHSDWVLGAQFSPDMSTVISVSIDRTIRLWDAASGQGLATFVGHSDAITSVTFSPDGKTLVSGSLDATIKLWDAASGQELVTLTGHSDAITSVAISPDGYTIASASWDNTFKLWDVATGQDLATFVGHSDIVSSVLFSPDGNTVLSIGRDQTAQLWDPATANQIRVINVIDPILGQYSPDGQSIFVATQDNEIFQFDVASGEELKRFIGRSGNITSLLVDVNAGRAVSGYNDGVLVMWNLENGQPLQQFTAHADRVSDISGSPKDLITSSYDNTFKIWSLLESKEMIDWIHGNLEVYELTCADRRDYRIQPLCTD